LEAAVIPMYDHQATIKT